MDILHWGVLWPILSKTKDPAILAHHTAMTFSWSSYNTVSCLLLLPSPSLYKFHNLPQSSRILSRRGHTQHISTAVRPNNLRCLTTLWAWDSHHLKFLCKCNFFRMSNSIHEGETCILMLQKSLMILRFLLLNLQALSQYTLTKYKKYQKLLSEFCEGCKWTALNKT